MKPPCHPLAASSVALVVALFAACGSSHTLSLGNYDTSCQKDTDCTAVFIGTPSGCCDCDNAAINGADSAKYQADLAADEQGLAQCNIACVSVCQNVTAVCAQGTCAITQAPDGG